MEEDQLYSVNQVAIILKVHPLTVRRYIKEYKLKAVKAGGNIRVPKSSVDAFTKDFDPTVREAKKVVKSHDDISPLAPDDPIFRLKARGMSLRPFGS